MRNTFNPLFFLNITFLFPINRTNQIDSRKRALNVTDQPSMKQNATAVGSALSIPPPHIPDVDTYFNLYVYAGIILATFLCSLARAFLYFHLAVTAGEKLHNQMFARSLRATMAFFDTNPVGELGLALFAAQGDKSFAINNR